MKFNIVPEDYDGVFHSDESEGNKNEAILSFKRRFPDRKIIAVVTIRKARKHYMKRGIGSEKAGAYDIYYMTKHQGYGYGGMLFACEHVISGVRKPELPIAYRDGIYCCKECRDNRDLSKLKTIHSDCLVGLGINPR